MVNYREILRLHSLNYSQRTISTSVHQSRNTVRDVISQAETQGIRWPLADEVTDQMIA